MPPEAVTENQDAADVTAAQDDSSTPLDEQAFTADMAKALNQLEAESPNIPDLPDDPVVPDVKENAPPSAEAVEPKESADADKEVSSASTEEGETKSDDEQEPAVEPERLAKAKAALKRDNLADDALQLIEGLPEERIVEIGEKAAKRQADQDRFANERNRLKETVDELLAEREESRKAEAAKVEVPVTATEVVRAKSSTVPELAQEMKDAITQSLDPLKNDEIHGDIADDLGVALTGLAERQASFHQTQLDQMRAAYDKSIAETNARLEEVVKARDGDRQAFLSMYDGIKLDQALVATNGEWSEMKSPEGLKRVEARAWSLAALPAWQDDRGNPDWAKVVEDAAHLEFGKQKQKRTQAAMAKRFKDQSEGQPEAVRERTEKAPDAMSDDEFMRQAYREIHDQGTSLREAEKKLARARVAG